MRPDQTRITRFELVRREALAMLLASTGLLLLSIFAPAPLSPPITAQSSLSETASAPWFFLWVQQLLKLGSPFLWGVVVPLALLVLVTLIPYIFPRPATSELGRWFPRSGRPAQMLVLAIVLAILALTIAALLPTS
jgi:quinol-cytochrome oxidoreductase complex cytochrome b subunit